MSERWTEIIKDGFRETKNGQGDDWAANTARQFDRIPSCNLKNSRIKI